MTSMAELIEEYIVTCPKCGKDQHVIPRKTRGSRKKCVFCGNSFSIDKRKKTKIEQKTIPSGNLRFPDVCLGCDQVTEGFSLLGCKADPKIRMLPEDCEKKRHPDCPKKREGQP